MVAAWDAVLPYWETLQSHYECNEQLLWLFYKSILLKCIDYTNSPTRAHAVSQRCSGSF